MVAGVVRGAGILGNAPQEAAQTSAESPSWVIRVGLAGPRRLPVYPGERTSSGPVAMSQRCQQRKSRLFDHFVANSRALLRWSFGQPGLPQSFFQSREVFSTPIRAQQVF